MLAGALITALLAGEAILRLLDLPSDPYAVRQGQILDPYDVNPFLIRARPFIHFHLPGSSYVQKAADYEVQYEINSRGFRGPEIDARPREGLRRLLVVGDSMVEGHGVEFRQTFPVLMNERLSSIGWEVLNVGVQGGSPAYYAANLTRYLALEPDAIVLVLYDNDLRDDFHAEKHYAELPVAVRSERLASAEMSVNRRGLRLGALLRRRLSHATLETASNPFEELYIERKKLGKVPTAQWPSKMEYCVPETEWPDVWDRSLDYMDLFAEQLRAEGIGLYVVHLSLEFRTPASDEACRKMAAFFERSVRQWAELRGLALLSLNDTLDDELTSDRRASFLYPSDGHPNQAGHELFAKTIGDWLLREGSIE